MPAQNKTRSGFPAYVTAILTLGALVLLCGWIGVAPREEPLPWTDLLYWFVLSLAAECFWLETATRAGMISMSLAVNMATVFVLPPHLALTIGVLSVGISDLLVHRRGVLRACFNASQTTISLAASIAVVHLLTGLNPPPGCRIFLEDPLAVLAAPVAFLLVNTFAVAGVISLHSFRPFWRTWRENYGHGYHFLSSGTQFLLGVALAFAAQAIGFVSGLLSLLLFFFVRDAYARYAREKAGRTGTEERVRQAA